VALLTLGSVPAQDLLTLITIFGRLRRSLPNHFNSRRGGLELVPYIKMAKICPIFETKSYVFVLLTRALEISVLQVSHLHPLQTLLLLFNPEFINISRQIVIIQYKTRTKNVRFNNLRKQVEAVLKSQGKLPGSESGLSGKQCMLAKAAIRRDRYIHPIHPSTHPHSMTRY